MTHPAADVLELDGLTVSILETPNLGDRSYVVDDGRSALVIDPQRDIDRVEAVLAARGVALAAVAETHAHNDYVSGGLELARKAGVPYLVPCEAEVAYERTEVCDHDVRTVGGMTVRTIGTPGHTPHHVSFAVGTGDEPTMVFTGGSMLYGATGRTDLVGPEHTDELTHAQYHSVRRLVDELPAGTPVFPGHGFGSFCAATPTSGDSSTVGEQAQVNPALTQSLLGHVKDLREQGMTVLFVEHDMDMVRDISDWVVVMAQGSVIAEGPPETIMSDPRVIDAYLGAHHDAPLSAEEEQEQLHEAEAALEEEAGISQEDAPAGPEAAKESVKERAE